MQTITLHPPTPTSQSSVSSRRKTNASSPSTCCTVGDGSGAQAAALAALGILASACSAAAAVIAGNPLGAYGDNGSCDFDCGFKEQTWSWSADYRFVNGNLQAAVTSLDFSSAYGAAFAPTQNWVGTDLPQFGLRLNSALQDIRQLDQAIIAAGGEVSPAQQNQLNTDFSSLNTMVANDLTEANSGLQTLAGFLSYEAGQSSQLADLVASSKAYIQTDATRCENDLIGKIACGSGSVQNSFNNMFTDVATKFATMQTSFNTVTSNFQTALNAADAVAGVFLVLQSDSSVLSEQLALTQTFAPTDPLRALHLNIAANMWGELVSTATVQLQPAD
jgi:hypothetical protein